MGFQMHSQVGQDMFAYFMCDTNSGYFLDIGSCEPTIINNSFSLEQQGWEGLCFDIVDRSDEYNSMRKTKLIAEDVTSINFREFLVEKATPKLIDYISIDVDEATEVFLEIFPFEEYEFKAITFEHDAYRQGEEFRNKSREFFKELGYTLVCGDVNVNEGKPFEDWYVNEKYVSKDKIDHLKCEGLHFPYILNRIMNY
jgi:hypothetical protein